MAELEVDLSFVGMEAWVEDLDFDEKVVVVEMAMKVLGFDLELWILLILKRWRILIKLSKSPIRILHPLCPWLVWILRLGPRLLPRIPIWRGLKIHRVVKPLILLPLPRSSWNKTERFYWIWIFLKDSFEPRNWRTILGLMILWANHTCFYNFCIQGAFP